MSTPNSLPPRFVLYIPTRSTKKDAFAGYILLNAIPMPDGKAQELNAAAHVTPYDTPPFVLKFSTNNTTPPLRVLLQNINTGMPLWATFVYENQVLQRADGGPSLPVLHLSTGKLTNFLPSHLKRNIPIVADAPKPVITTTVPSPALPPPLLTPAGGAGDPTPLSPPPQPMTPVAALTAKPTKLKKPLKPKQPLPPPEGDLSFHVARQLLDLARIRKTECPIIAEELSEGNTAAMPCGHLFSRLAIEESFKTERYRCPACRLSGMPTFV